MPEEAGGAVGPPTSEPGETVSVVRFEADQWVLANPDHPGATVRGDWLADVIAGHRALLALETDERLGLRYLIGDADVAERIAAVRAAGARIAGLRREAARSESEIRADRQALMRDLAERRVAPSEIAHITNVPVTAVPKDLGSDADTREARHRTHGTTSRRSSNG